jgi:hypothetical protein
MDLDSGRRAAYGWPTSGPALRACGRCREAGGGEQVAAVAFAFVAAASARPIDSERGRGTNHCRRPQPRPPARQRVSRACGRSRGPAPALPPRWGEHHRESIIELCHCRGFQTPQTTPRYHEQLCTSGPLRLAPSRRNCVSRSSSPHTGPSSRSCVRGMLARGSRSSASCTCLRSKKPRSRILLFVWR